MRNSLLEVTPVIPESLSRLPELAANLFFSWHRPTRALFEDLDPELWKQTNGNPRLMLRCVDQLTLDRYAHDEVYLARYRQALETLEAYLRVTVPAGDEPLVAYFCAEYGFHESFPIYSGGLGVLAGDYCKAASDERANFVAVGLLYEQGYFTQTVDNDGVQHAEYRERDLRPRHHSPPLRRRRVDPRAPGDDPRDRGHQDSARARGAARRVAPQRGACGVSDPRAAARAPLAGTALQRGPRGGGRGLRVHHPYTGRGRPRRLRARVDRRALRRLRARARRAGRARPRSGARPLEPGSLQHDAPRALRHAPCQRREPHPWGGVGAAGRGPVARGAPRGQPDRLRDQRRARTDLPPPVLDGFLRSRAGRRVARAAAGSGILERARARAGRALLGDRAGGEGADARERARAAAARVRAQGPLSRARSRRSEEHTSELQSRGHLVCRLLLEKKDALT